MIRDFKKAGNPLDRICKETLGCGVQEIFISYKDHFEVDILINTYKTQYCLIGVSRLEALEVENGNVALLVKAINDLLENEAQRLQYAQQAHNRVERLFCIENVAAEIVGLYA